MREELIRKNTTGDGEVVSLVVQKNDGRIETVEGTTENILKYDTDLLADFSDGNTVSYGDVKVRRIDNRTFEIENKGVAVRNVPSESEEVMKALREAHEDGQVGRLKRLWGDINHRQVTRDAVNSLIGSFLPKDRVDVTNSGWEIESETGIIFVLTWENEVYHISQEQDKAYVRNGDTVKALEGGAEFLNLEMQIPEGKTMGDEDTVFLSSEDLEFVTKAKWLLEAENQYEDKYFWNFIRRYQGDKI
jgi:hypothetical protein